MMLRAVNTLTRSLFAICLVSVAAAAGCGKSATPENVEAPTGQGQAPASTQPGTSTKPGSTAGSTGVAAKAGTGAANAPAAAAGSTSSAGATASAAGTVAASGGAAGEVATNGGAAGSAGAVGAPARTAPSHPGVPPDVASAWGEWPLPGRDYNNTRYTQDSPINSTNVSKLKEAWRVQFPGLVIAYGMISTVPLIAAGTVYIEDTYCNVRAIDLASGKVKWMVEGGDLNPGPNGVAFGWGKVFAIRGSDSVAAYDAASGKQLWLKNVVDTQTAGIDIQPTVFDGQVLISTVPISTRGIYTPGDRGILKALDQESGAEKWRFDTIEGEDFWGNEGVNSGGGSWYPPSIDVDTNRVFWAVANPAPFPGTAEFPNGSSRPGLNLYSDSTLVLDVKTGGYQWHHQTIEHDIFDRDLLHTMLGEVDGVPIVVSTGKEGRVWANRRDTGEVLWGPIPVGMHKNDELKELTGMTELLPGSFGGVLTPPALADGVVYVAELNAPSMYTANATSYFGSSVGTMNGDLVAIDAATGKILWDTSVEGDPTGGVTVVNDLVITATFQGNVIAYARDTGKEVWRWKAPGGINSWMSVSGDTLVIPVGASDPAVLVALRLDGAAAPGGNTAAGSGAAGSGGTAGAGSAAGAATFSAIYKDILAPRCAGPVCHSGGMTGGNLNVMGASASAVRMTLLDKPAGGTECMSSGLSLVKASQPEQSLLYRKLTDTPPCGSRMPPTGALPAADLDRIRKWIADGAADN
ncbi:MAG TPA: PQQ-binding-like beta-propeller repeat protein [Polyangiales bacterium]|nr:PQQ-binding-like beta-propeller repeat protein [Polyangiales bacterium]